MSYTLATIVWRSRTDIQVQQFRTSRVFEWRFESYTQYDFSCHLTVVFVSRIDSAHAKINTHCKWALCACNASEKETREGEKERFKVKAARILFSFGFVTLLLQFINCQKRLIEWNEMDLFRDDEYYFLHEKGQKNVLKIIMYEKCFRLGLADRVQFDAMYSLPSDRQILCNKLFSFGWLIANSITNKRQIEERSERNLAWYPHTHTYTLLGMKKCLLMNDHVSNTKDIITFIADNYTDKRCQRVRRYS